MPITAGQVLIASVTVLTILGLMFEIGRRLGRGSADREQMEESVEDLEGRMDDNFTRIERRLDQEAAIRQNQHAVVIDWLGVLTDSLQDEGYDVRRPDEIRETVDVDDEFPSGD